MRYEYDVKTPEDVLEKVRDVLVENNWTILNNCTPDLAIDAGNGTIPNNYYDGNVLAAKRNDMIVVLRSVNGLRVLPSQPTVPYVWKENPTSYKKFLNRTIRGVVITSCTNYTSNPSSGMWYDQTNVVCNESGDAIGSFIPVPNLDDIRSLGGFYKDYYTKVVINYVENDCISCLVSLEQGYSSVEARVNGSMPYRDVDKEGTFDIDYRKTFAHLGFCEIQKIGAWVGGTCITGSLPSHNMDVQTEMYNEDTTKWLGCVISGYHGLKEPIDGIVGSNVIYGMSDEPSTFCYVEVDGAPQRLPPVLWAAAGPRTGKVTSTGKVLGLPIANLDYFDKMPSVPHFCNIQSQNEDDFGINTNTLNAISVDLPLYAYILRDPDVLENFSQLGYISNVYAVSMRHLASKGIYKFHYPDDEEHQVFPHDIRHSNEHGYDGIAILQMYDDE